MEENEVIIVDNIPDQHYDMLIEESIKYAVISLPFTVNRMSISDEKKRALNIAKGKVAEALFGYFCKSNHINTDFGSCSTPFWTVDNRDFLLNSSEWDLKNNFLYHAGENYQRNYTDLPALVPNRFSNDQWGKRNKRSVSQSEKVEFLFTFLKSADLTDGNRGDDFLEIILSHQQEQFIAELYKKYQGQLQNNKPFDENWFWKEMNNRGSINIFKLHFKPSLIITGFANSNHWDHFKDTGPYDGSNNFQKYIDPLWYLKTQKGSCKFLNGTLWTTITNATTPVSKLPSFLSLYPDLRQDIKNGRIKT